MEGKNWLGVCSLAQTRRLRQIKKTSKGGEDFFGLKKSVFLIPIRPENDSEDFLLALKKGFLSPGPSPKKGL